MEHVPNVEVAHKSVGQTVAAVQDQGVPLLTHFQVSEPVSEPLTELIIEEELKSVYVQAYRSQFSEEEVPKEKLITAVKYLNTLRGGIAMHRKSENLMDALEHIDCMRSRLDYSGLPLEYSYEELRNLMVKENEYMPEDFDRVLEKFCETRDFLPSPREFIDLHANMKGIVQLEKKLEETIKALERSQSMVEEKNHFLLEKQRRLRELEEENARLSSRAICKSCLDRKEGAGVVYT